MNVIERLRHAIAYDPVNGELRWKQTVNGRWAKAGELCGGLDAKGYRTLALDGRQYKAHRVAWAIHYGVWPEGLIDHIDHNRTNNAIGNLREATQAINSQNLVRAQARNRSGLLGVYPLHRKWGARIMANGTRMYLGSFDSPADAHQAYLSAKRRYHQGNTL